MRFTFKLFPCTWHFSGLLILTVLLFFLCQQSILQTDAICLYEAVMHAFLNKSIWNSFLHINSRWPSHLSLMQLQLFTGVLKLPRNCFNGLNLPFQFSAKSRIQFWIVLHHSSWPHTLRSIVYITYWSAYCYGVSKLFGLGTPIVGKPYSHPLSSRAWDKAYQGFWIEFWIIL